MYEFSSFEQFLEDFIPKVSAKERQKNLAFWILETTGSVDAAKLMEELGIEYHLLFTDKKTFEQLQAWEHALDDPSLKRQCNILRRRFMEHQVNPSLLRAISKEEAELSLEYANFRPTIDGVEVSENAILERLKKENNYEKRKKIWEASKEIGRVLAPRILSLVELRNKAAKELGFKTYFSMQLELQEIDLAWLFKTLNDLSDQSENAYRQVLEEITKKQTTRFNIEKEEMAPWAWSDPFCQLDPLGSQVLDQITEGMDLVETCKNFYNQIGFDVSSILENSDMFERPGKNQHAFCINIDRNCDIRTLNNLTPSIRWLETLLHELGHAVYEQGYVKKMPWLLKEPPHMLTTEAIALVAGRQAYRTDSLKLLAKNPSPPLLKEAEASLKRRQLIFSRWVLVMTFFEKELYENPSQDLNALWWSLIKKYQLISMPSSRSNCSDWAAKYHMGLAPVYYYSYLLGELLASSLENIIKNKFTEFGTKETGSFLTKKIFEKGNSLPWHGLAEDVLLNPLSSRDWLKQFALA